jgi:hypothetical protein
VVHGYTNPANGTDTSKASAYDARADKKSWAAMQGLLGEIFPR